jgi:hypothetical protein
MALPEDAPYYVDNESTIGPASAPPSSVGMQEESTGERDAGLKGLEAIV